MENKINGILIKTRLKIKTESFRNKQANSLWKK